MIKKILVKMINKINSWNSLIRMFYWKILLKKTGNNVKLWKGVQIHGPSFVQIGNNSGIGNNVIIWGEGGVDIGKDVLIAANCVITSQTHDTNAPIYRKTNIKKKITIMDNVWIGANAVVMPGVTIKRNSIIGAGSIVTKDIAENSIALGNPAKIVKEIK